MFKQIILGLFIVAFGGVIMYFSYNFVEMFGRIPRAEKNLGGTRSAYVLGGFGMVLVGFLIMFGVIPLSSPTELGGISPQ